MRKLTIFLLTVILLTVSFFSVLTVSAQNNCTITVAKTSGNIGESVFLPISISNNPGISGITIDITYDSSALSFVTHSKGAAFTDNYMLKDHPDKNCIKIALVEKSKDSVNNDDILTIEFKIKENTNADFYPVSIKYDKGDFANRNLESIMPEIISGGVEVKYSPEAKNCAHKTYGDWTTAIKPTCTKNGLLQRICTVCGHSDTKETEPAGHVFEDVWTIDKPAKENEDGVMTRHCKHCTYSTDRITFPLKNEESFDNTIGTEVPKNDFTLGLFNEQNPGQNLTQNGSSKVQQSTQNSSSVINSVISENSEVASSEIVSQQNTSSIDSNIEADTTVSQVENITTNNNKLVVLIFGGIIFVILLAIIAIVACQKTK